MASLNKAMIIGNLGSDPEIKYMQSGDAVCNFSVATTESWKDKDGNKQEKTEWHRIVVWKKLAEVCAEWLHKGSQVYVEGRIQTRKWEDKNGQDKYTTEIVAREIVFVGGKRDSSQVRDKPQSQGQQQPIPGDDAPPF